MAAYRWRAIIDIDGILEATEATVLDATCYVPHSGLDDDQREIVVQRLRAGQTLLLAAHTEAAIHDALDQIELMLAPAMGNA